MTQTRREALKWLAGCLVAPIVATKEIPATKRWRSRLLKNKDEINEALSSFNNAKMIISWGGIRKSGNEEFEEVEMVVKMHVWK